MLLKGTSVFGVLSESKIQDLIKCSWEIQLRKGDKLYEVKI